MLSLLELLHRISVANLLLEYEPPEISGGKRGLRFFRPWKISNLEICGSSGGWAEVLAQWSSAHLPPGQRNCPRDYQFFIRGVVGRAQLKKWESGMPLAPMGNTAGGFQYVENVHLLFGKWSILINVFQVGWNGWNMDETQHDRRYSKEQRNICFVEFQLFICYVVISCDFKHAI